jgi:hypothetical protein
MGFVAAGHETTMNLLSAALYHVLSVPERWRSIQNESASVSALIEEVLRFDPPAAAVWRTAARKAQIGEVEVRPGERVYLVLGAANRDRSVFEQPDRFLVGRADDEQHLSFGRGIHFCVGAALARLEGCVALEQLAHRLPSLRLAADFVPTYRPNAVQRFMDALPVEWGTGSSDPARSIANSSSEGR